MPIPKVTPFWYTPEGQNDGEQVSFKLRPLTQPQIVDVEEHYRDGRMTGKATYVAGTLGIVGVKGFRHPETGDPAVPPQCFDWLPRSWVRLCGTRLLANDQGIDWDAQMAELINGETPEEDPQGNLQSQP